MNGKQLFDRLLPPALIPYRRMILLIFVVAALVRLGLFAWSFENNPNFFFDDDSKGYLALAENIRLGNGFTWDEQPPYDPDSFRTPGYPVFLLLHKIIFNSYWPALGTQIFLSIVIAYLVMRIGVEVFSARVGIFAAAAFLFMPFSIMVSLRFLTQVFFTTVFMMGIWFWLRHLRSGSTKTLFVAGVLMPLTALIRPIAMFSYVPLLASLGLALARRVISWRTVIIRSILVVTLFLAVLSPWMWRNYEVFGVFSLSSLSTNFLFFYDAPAVYSRAHGVSFEEARAAIVRDIEERTGRKESEENLFATFSSVTPIMLERAKHYLFEDVGAFIETRTILFFKFFVRDGIRYWFEESPFRVPERIAFLGSLIERGILGLFFIGFVFVSARALFSWDVRVMTLSLFVLYFATLTGIMASAGLRYPAEPLFLLLGTAGAMQIIEIARSKLREKLSGVHAR